MSSKLEKLPIIGSLKGIIKEEAMAPLVEMFLRSLRGKIADPPKKPIKKDLDPAEMGATKLPTYVEDIDYKTTDLGVLMPRKEVDIADLQGRTLTPAYGDRTYAGMTLDEIAGVKLDQPVQMQGGNQYMREGQGLWASLKDAMDTKAKAMSEMDDPLMIYTAMAGQSGDFSKMMSDATMGMIEQSKITKKAAKTYDDQVKKEIDPNWVGILNPKAREYLDKMPGTDRRLLWQTMDKDSYKKLGFPDLGVVRTAITERELLTLPPFATGRSIGALESFLTSPTPTHKTYDTEVIGKYKGALPYDVPGQMVFRDFFKMMSERPRGAKGGLPNPQRAFQMTPSIQQKVDQQMVDEISVFNEIMKDRN